MYVLFIALALCYLLAQWDGLASPTRHVNTLVLRLIISGLGIVLWILSIAGMIQLPIWVKG